MDTLYCIGLAILLVYSIITTRIVFVMRKDLMKRRPKGKLYFVGDEFYCEFNIEPKEISKQDYITLRVIKVKDNDGGAYYD